MTYMRRGGIVRRGTLTRLRTRWRIMGMAMRRGFRTIDIDIIYIVLCV